MTTVYTLLSVLIVSCLSLLGGLLLAVKKTHIERVIFYSLALSTGVILGAVFFDIVPESLELAGENTYTLLLVGFVGAFAVEKFLNWHHHIDGDHHENSEKAAGYLTLIGDGIHNFVDGTVIATAYLVSPAVGISTTFAVVAHEIPHELADFAVLLGSGFKPKKALWYNFLSALTAVAGSLFVLVLSNQAAGIEKYLLPFAAGNFLYIASSDLIPQLHKRNTFVVSLVQLGLMIVGIYLMSVLVGLEK